MATIFFEILDGSRVAVTAEAGDVVMELARAQGIDGIEAECGGGLSCATCHVHVDPAWIDKVGCPGELERDLLELDGDVTTTSRLSCQIEVTDALDGLIVRIVGR